MGVILYLYLADEKDMKNRKTMTPRYSTVSLLPSHPSPYPKTCSIAPDFGTSGVLPNDSVDNPCPSMSACTSADSSIEICTGRK
jgi:hypothetical protein